jgi:hypothetical protein
MAGAQPGASSRIFISYRREDSSGHVLALLPSLRSHFGADRIFKDTDNIPPGADFLKFIKNELESCSVLLAIIGREWLTIQDARLKRRRIDNPDDFLRVEVSTALKNERIRVIPVLIERAPMPSAQDLPPDLADLSFRNAIELSDVRWESDVRLLIEAVEHAVTESTAKPEAPMRPGLMELQKRRAREIASQLENARQAFESGDFEGTLWACDKALLLDPQTPEALDLVDRARKALDEKKISAWLEDARKALARGDIGAASDLIDQALAVDSESQRALTIRDEMLELRRERERERDRARTVQAATDRARASVEEGDFESAVRHADDALATDSGDLNAQSIKAKALAALDERRKQRDLKRRAQQTVSDARSTFEAGAHQDALASLREFSPGHELVSQALRELEDQLHAIQQKIAAENERLEELRRAEEAQRAAAEQARAEKEAREEAEKKAREDKERRDREQREEEARLLAEARAAEELRRQQEKEAQSLAEEQRKLAEAQRKEEERKKEEERRRNEERRKKEEEGARQRAAEQERIRKEDEARRLAEEAQRRKEAEDAERRREAEEARWRKEAEKARQQKAEEARRQKEAQEARRRKEEEDAQRRLADEARASQAAAASTPLVTDENVQFTVFRRSTIQPELWYPLLCFAHLAERRPDAPDELDPIEEVQAQARQILKEDIGEFRSATEDSGYPVAREGELRFVPRIDGVVFNPPERRFLWTESVHREDFRMRAGKSMDGRVARGAVSVFYGSLLLAEVQLSIKVDRKLTDSRREETHARPYRRIFASYSHRDTAIVEEFESHAVATGDSYLRDVVALHAGEVWDERLVEMIKQADVFQLFWSRNALRSDRVREEWQRALALNRPHFVRPVYWEEPLPEEAGLPPQELKRLHFQRVYPRVPSAHLPLPLPSRITAPPPVTLQEPSRVSVSRLIRYGSVAAVLVAAIGLYWTVPSGPPFADPSRSQVQTPRPSTPEPSTTPGSSGGAVTAPPPVQNPAVESPSPAPAEPPSTAVKQAPTVVVPMPTPTARRGAPPSRQGNNPPATAKPQEPAPAAPTPSQPAPTPPISTTPIGKTPPPETPPAMTAKESESPPPVVAAKPQPSEAAKPPVPDRLEEERRVRGALERYESAYDNLDAAAVMALYPGAPANLATTFAQYQFYRLELVVQRVTLAPDLNSATAVARLSHFFQPRVGRSQQYVRTQEFSFEKRGNSWIIVRMR